MNSIDTHAYLTSNQSKLIETILNSQLDVNGYEKLLLSTLKTNTYRYEDRIWLNVIRRKWIRYLTQKLGKK